MILILQSIQLIISFFKGNYYMLINAKTGEIIESGADEDRMASWLNG
jgi:hypothetical protein